MSIITVASTKGGVGKSTFIINLASIFLMNDKKIAILDADIQNSVGKWNKIREYMIAEGANIKPLFIASSRGEALIEVANDKKNQGYTVLIDSPGIDDANMRTALLRSDYIINPCPVSSIDLWEVESLMKIINNLQRIQHRKIPLILVFNKVPTRHSTTPVTEARKFFDDNNIIPDYILEHSIKERVVFKHSIRDGKTIVDYSPFDEKAKKEMTGCYYEIMDIVKK